jgi:hypothetical protein
MTSNSIIERTAMVKREFDRAESLSRDLAMTMGNEDEPETGNLDVMNNTAQNKEVGTEEMEPECPE